MVWYVDVNVCVSRDFGSIIWVHNTGIEALLKLLRTEDMEAGRYAAFALSNLSANANHRDKIVEVGGVASLIALACCEDINAQKQALVALRGLCITPEYRAVVVREGKLLLILLISSFIFDKCIVVNLSYLKKSSSFWAQLDLLFVLLFILISFQ